jgi:hypothetical protein
MGRFSKKVSRLAALGLLVAVVAVLTFGVALPITELVQELPQALEDERRQLREYRAFAAQDSELAGIGNGIVRHSRLASSCPAKPNLGTAPTCRRC